METAMFNCKEIRDIAPFEVGRETDKGIIVDKDGLSSKWVVYSEKYETSLRYSEEDLIPFPTVEELADRLIPHIKTMPFRRYETRNFSDKVLAWIPENVREPKAFEGDTLLSALVQLWMWIEHSKVWKDNQWT